MFSQRSYILFRDGATTHEDIVKILQYRETNRGRDLGKLAIDAPAAGDGFSMFQTEIERVSQSFRFACARANGTAFTDCEWFSRV